MTKDSSFVADRTSECWKKGLSPFIFYYSEYWTLVFEKSENGWKMKRDCVLALLSGHVLSWPIPKVCFLFLITGIPHINDRLANEIIILITHYFNENIRVESKAWSCVLTLRTLTRLQNATLWERTAWAAHWHIQGHICEQAGWSTAEQGLSGTSWWIPKTSTPQTRGNNLSSSAASRGKG